jgi:hypothetical protein
MPAILPAPIDAIWADLSVALRSWPALLSLLVPLFSLLQTGSLLRLLNRYFPITAMRIIYGYLFIYLFILYSLTVAIYFHFMINSQLFGRTSSREMSAVFILYISSLIFMSLYIGRPSFWALTYLILIPSYSSMYSSFPSAQFYHSYIKYEDLYQSSITDLYVAINNGITETMNIKDKFYPIKIKCSSPGEDDAITHYASFNIVSTSRPNLSPDIYKGLHTDSVALTSTLIVHASSNCNNNFLTKDNSFSLTLYSYPFIDLNNDRSIFRNCPALYIAHLKNDESPSNNIMRPEYILLNFQEIIDSGEAARNAINLSPVREYPYDLNSYLYVCGDSSMYQNMFLLKRASEGDPLSGEDNLIRMLYLSTVTITTLGFGDIVPTSSSSRLLVTSEAVLGVVVAGMFINSVFSPKEFPKGSIDSPKATLE